MRTEAEIRQTIDWLRHAITIQMPPDCEEARWVIGSMRGQIDCLLWALGEPNGWDAAHKMMADYHAKHGEPTFPSRN